MTTLKDLLAWHEAAEPFQDFAKEINKMEMFNDF